MVHVYFLLHELFQGDPKNKIDSGLKRNRCDTFGKIDSYFTKKPKHETNDLHNNITTNSACDSSYSAAASTSSSSSASTSTNFDEKKNSTSVSPVTNTPISDFQQLEKFSSDIGWHVGNKIDDSTKAMLLEKHWVPPPNYIFPHCVVKKNNKQTKKYAQRSHLDKFHWLVLSPKDQGLYCKYCALFAVKSNTSLKRLVTEPLKVFDNLLGENGVLLTHQRNKYHEKAVEIGKTFLSTFHKPENIILNQICSKRMKEINENRERLRPIVKTIILCGRQNIPLRGHRDDGKLLLNVNSQTNSLPENDSVLSHEGNFRALLRFRIDSGDTKLQHHLETSKSNATYISKTVQNELIDVCKEIIQENILENVREAKYFSVLFDETTDLSHTSQLSLSFRYLHNNIAREDFVTFCDIHEMLRSNEMDNITGDTELRLTGVALANIVEKLCSKFNVDLKWCVGIGTDSCSVMSSATKGAVQELSKTAVHAKRCPCSNHILNNSLAMSSKVTSCRNTSGTMRKVVAFANASAKRHQIFERELGVAVQSICETRWVERHDGHLQFQGENLLKICRALETISTWQDSKTANDAHCLLQTLRSSDFIISSICLCDVLGKYIYTYMFFPHFFLMNSKLN